MALFLNKLSRKNKITIIVLLLLFSAGLTGIILFIKANTLANFKIENSYLLQDNIEQEIDKLPIKLRFTSNAKRADQYQWKVFKIGDANADTSYNDLATFDQNFLQLGKYGVQLNATGKGGSDVKLKILTLKLSDNFQNNLIAQFEQAFKQSVNNGYSMNSLKKHDDLTNVLGDDFNLKLHRNGQEINETQLQKLLKEGKYKSLDFLDYQFDEVARIKFTKVNFTFPKKSSSGEIPSSGEVEVVIDPSRPNFPKPDEEPNIKPGEYEDPSTNPTTLTAGTEPATTNSPKGSSCKDLQWDFPASEKNKFNTKNLKIDKRVLMVNKSYTFAYHNCGEQLEWKLNKRSKGKGSFDHTFKSPGLYEICLEGKGCDSVLVAYSAENIHHRFKKIIDSPVGKDVSKDVRRLADMMVNSEKQGAIDFEQDQMTLKQWVGKQRIGKRVNPDLKLPPYSITLHPKTGEILRISFR